MKTCTKCKETKNLSEFNKSKNNKDGLNAWCRICNNEYSREWAKKNKERHQRNYTNWRKNNLERADDLDRLRSYGLPKGNYEKILKLQNYSCAICKTKTPSPKRNFCVDHCHETDRVRGLLCIKCNFLLGSAKDSIIILQNAIDFLNETKNIDYRTSFDPNEKES
jgi:hypothetical protein